MQNEITRVIPLLDERGNLTEAGFARRLLPVYKRADIKAPGWRIKEWDYYYIGNDRFGLALTIDDNSYMGLDSISLLCFGEKPWQITKSPMRWLTFGKTGLPETSKEGVTEISGKGYFLRFDVAGGVRKLTSHMEKFRGDEAIDLSVTLSEEPEESMVICTPFEKEGHFYYNQKINCMRAEGYVKLGGEEYIFTPEDSFGTLDWGRGVWTYHNTWLWGSASGLVGGNTFGFNIGYGFGDVSAASENMLWYRGKTHKLGRLTIDIPGKPGHRDYMSPWTITEEEGRFVMEFVPFLDRAACTDVKLIKSDQHQVFGHYYGEAVLEDGKKLFINGLTGFCEEVENKW